MTEPRPWPNEAAHARNQAAERINMANTSLDSVQRLDISVEAKIKIYQAQRHLIDAMRWLESMGAPTRPTEM